MARLIALFLVAAILVAVPFLIFGDSVEAYLSKDWLTDAFSEYRAYAWLAAILLLVSDILLPIPNTIIMAAMGIVYGPILGGLVSAAGLALSGLAGYGLCRALGRPAAVWLLSERELQESERLMCRVGGLIVVISRWIPIVSEAVACLAGLARMPLPVFGLALACGVLPVGMVVAAVGFAGADRPILTLLFSALLPLPLWFAARATLFCVGQRDSLRAP